MPSVDDVMFNLGELDEELSLLLKELTDAEFYAVTQTFARIIHAKKDSFESPKQVARECMEFLRGVKLMHKEIPPCGSEKERGADEGTKPSGIHSDQPTEG